MFIHIIIFQNKHTFSNVKNSVKIFKKIVWRKMRNIAYFFYLFIFIRRDLKREYKHEKMSKA